MTSFLITHSHYILAAVCLLTIAVLFFFAVHWKAHARGRGSQRSGAGVEKAS